MLLDLKYLVQKYNIIPSRGGILHLGASTGQEAQSYWDMGYRKVVFVEAIPKVYEQLKVNVDKYGFIAINECVGDEDGKEVVFNISNNEAQSSSYLEFGEHKKIHPTVFYVDTINLKMKRTETLYDEIWKEYYHQILGINFLNMDLQGGEYAALKGLGERLNHFSYLYLELNKRETYLGCGLVNEIDAYVKKFGFERVETGNWIGDCWTDGFYIKSK